MITKKPISNNLTRSDKMCKWYVLLTSYAQNRLSNEIIYHSLKIKYTHYRYLDRRLKDRRMKLHLYYHTSF